MPASTQQRLIATMRQAGGRPGRWDVPLILSGCLVMALAFRLFLNGNGLVAGGVVGLSTILQHKFGWDPALFQWAVNVPLLVLTFFILGKAAGLRSVLGSLFLPLAILLTAPVPVVTRDAFLAALFGGALYGLGLGMALRGRGSVGGYSIFAQFLAKWLPVSVPAVILVLDALTIFAGASAFPIDKVLLGVFAAFIVRQGVDRVLVGLTPSMAAFIVCSDPAELKQRILDEMDRGVTLLAGEGGFTGEQRPVIMVAVLKAEVPWLRQVIAESDPDAFVVITEAAEVRGRGFARS
ncbi:MAG: YitT family protein [Armatimonadetes bacterium]|nr:YitT family protein [Armatimonadota bacterium]